MSTHFFFFLREIIPYLVYMFFFKYLLEWGGLTKYNNQILKKKKVIYWFPTAIYSNLLIWGRNSTPVFRHVVAPLALNTHQSLKFKQLIN